MGSTSTIQVDDVSRLIGLAFPPRASVRGVALPSTCSSRSRTSRLSSTEVHTHPFLPLASRSEFPAPVCPPYTLARDVCSRSCGWTCPLVGFGDPPTFWLREATYTGLASSGCAAPSGSLSLLTRCSARPFPALFHAGDVHGFSLTTFRVFPPVVARSCSHVRSQSSQ